MRKQLKATKNQSNNCANLETDSFKTALQSKQSTPAQSSYISVSDEDLDVIVGGQTLERSIIYRTYAKKPGF